MALSRRGVKTMVTPSTRVNRAANRARVSPLGARLVSWTRPSLSTSRLSRTHPANRARLPSSRMLAGRRLSSTGSTPLSSRAKSRSTAESTPAAVHFPFRACSPRPYSSASWAGGASGGGGASARAFRSRKG